MLSNVFCGIVAAIFLFTHHHHNDAYPTWLLTLKLTAASAVTITFLVVACFFGPLYGYGRLYLGSNLWFHLIIPLLGIVEFCLINGKLPFRMTFLTGAPALLYGCVYLGNILINGKGEWPNTNDWYGFMNWGMGPAMVIFAVIILTSWGTGCVLRWINSKIGKHTAHQNLTKVIATDIKNNTITVKVINRNFTHLFLFLGMPFASLFFFNKIMGAIELILLSPFQI